MKKICLILALLFLLLSGCGGKTLDANTQALVEKSDAVCLVTVKRGEVHEVAPGNWDYLMTCLIRTDYLGNLTERGQDLNGQDHQYVFVLIEDGEYWPAEGSRLLLFLNRTEKSAYWRNGYMEYYPFYVPRLPAGLRREPADAVGLRLLEALREYGRTHPREVEENAVYDGREDYGLWMII
ncbi:MAG: hypothetical protein IKX47_02870 [Oscillospiraceae bacterium]|nr:hypothetical protein [Oscillospiraceae bacterium]